jgi:site-specific DNA-cytosine methylase
MKVISLFDGISCARVALERAGINVESYYASEIDKYAIQISQKNYPDIQHVGSVTELLFSNAEYEQYKDIDLLIGGSPCQDLSIAKAGRKGLEGERSGLFYEYVRILKEVKPKYFILENVASMSKESKDKISEVLGVQPIMINASLVSAQNRKRLFWTNIPNVIQPEDRGILLKDIIESGDVDRLKSYCIDANYWKGASLEHYLSKGVRQLVFSSEKRRTDVRILNEKSNTLTSSYRGVLDGDSRMGVIIDDKVRKLTPIECERLQGLPDNYTEGVSNTQRYKTLGNAFNVDVVAHILKHLV